MNVVETETKGASSTGSGAEPEMSMPRVQLISYGVLALVIVLVGVLKLGAPFLALLFSYYILTHFRLLKRNWLKIAVFLALVSVVCAGLVYALDQAIKHLPHVVDKAIPAMIGTAQKYGLELPFTDWDSLKDFAVDTAKGELHTVGTVAGNAARQFVFLIIGIVIAASMFLKPFSTVLREGGVGSDTVYAVYATQIAARFRSFFESFAKVMGAQLIISIINTVLTAIFILAVGLKYAAVGIGVTFLCGLLPIVGNLISNTVLVVIGFTESPQLALWCLVFLVVLHKLEYFLNSKIVGRQIKNPVWLTLIGLVLGERLMGIPGMILAPVVLDYIRVEASRIKMQAPQEAG